MTEDATAQPAVILHNENAVRVLTLACGPRANALNEATQRTLLQALRDCAADTSVRALVLTGAGRTFCVGADLTEVSPFVASSPGTSIGSRTAEMMAELINPIVTTLQQLPMPVVCAINGAAAGAGVGLALAADVVLMARSAYLYLPFMPRLGLVPDMGSSWFLARQIGRQRATALTLLGEHLPAERVVEWGLAWSCVDDADLPAAALSLAQRLAALPSHAALETRQLYDAAASHSLPEQLEYERLRQRELLDQPSFMEGVQAFICKRDPVFAPRSPSSTSQEAS